TLCEDHQASPRPHFGREEIGAGDHAPMCPQKRLPRGRPLRHRTNGVLVCDRDRKWSREVRSLLGEASVRVVQTPLQAPSANGHAERFVRSIMEECLGRGIPLGERHFRRTVAESGCTTIVNEVIKGGAISVLNGLSVTSG